MNYKNIAISGEIGTGTTTLAKALAKKINFKHLNGGVHLRSWLSEHGFDPEDPTKIPKDIDNQLDFSFQEKMGGEKGIVFESRLSGWLAKDLKDVYKILIVCDFDQRMKRVANREGISREEAEKSSVRRSKTLDEKFERLYNTTDYLDPKYFDLVIDTTNLNQDQVLESVLEKLA